LFLSVSGSGFVVVKNPVIILYGDANITVESISPSEQQGLVGGAVIEVLGTGFWKTNLIEVKVGNASANCFNSTNERITCISPSQSDFGSFGVMVKLGDMESFVSSAGVAFSYNKPVQHPTDLHKTSSGISQTTVIIIIVVASGGFVLLVVALAVILVLVRRKHAKRKHPKYTQEVSLSDNNKRVSVFNFGLPIAQRSNISRKVSMPEIVTHAEMFGMTINMNDLHIEKQIGQG
jgi:hypothetical protein